MLHPPGINAFARGHELTNLGVFALEPGYVWLELEAGQPPEYEDEAAE